MEINLINVSQHPANGLEPEERDFWGVFAVDAITYWVYENSHRPITVPNQELLK